MKINYFVQAEGERVLYNVSRVVAINKAKKLYDEGNHAVGIGKFKTVKGKSCYNLLPLSYYI
jgi:hypothetical protein